MKKTIITVICAIVVVVAISLILFNYSEPDGVYVSSIHINSDTVRLESDMSKKLSITVHPDGATEKGYKLVSENEFVTICDGANVIAVNEGETFVYAKSSDGKVKSNKIKVIVSNNIFEVASKIILSAQNAQYVNKQLAEEIEQSKQLLKPEENELSEKEESPEEVEVTAEKASQITETEIKEVPELFEISVETDENNAVETENSTAEVNATDIVYVTKSGGKFHLSTCSYAKEAVAVSRSQAVSDGKTPCKKCNP